MSDHKPSFPWSTVMVCLTVLIIALVVWEGLSQRYDKDKLIVETKDEVRIVENTCEDKLKNCEKDNIMCQNKYDKYRSKEAGFWDRIRFGEDTAQKIEKLNKEIASCRLERDEIKKSKVKEEKCWVF